MPLMTSEVGSSIVVTMDWQDRRNALGPEEAGEVARAIEAAATSSASTLILTGNGAFCAGGDLRAFAALSEKLTADEIRRDVYGNVQAIVRALRDLPIPSIAAVDGPAIGLGMDLALACDMRFVGPDGWLRQGWARAGLISATAGSWFLERTRRGSMWELVSDQPRLDPQHCVALGLATACEGTAFEAALERGAKLADIPRDVLLAYARLSRLEQWPSDEYLDLCADYQAGFIAGEQFRGFAQGLLEQGQS